MKGLAEATKESKQQLQRSTITPISKLLSCTDPDKEEGRGPEGTVDTLTPTANLTPTATYTPTELLEGTTPESTSKGKAIER